MFRIFFTLFLLSVATITDLKSRIIPDWLTKPTIAFFTLYWIFLGNYGAFFVLVSVFLVAYIGYRVGLWAGGDTKLFTAVAAVYPDTASIFGVSVPFPFLLMAGSLIVGFFLAFAYLVFKVFKDGELREKFSKGFVWDVARAFSITVFFGSFGVAGLLAGFFPVKITAPLAVVLAVALKSFNVDTFFLFVVFYFLIALLKYRGYVFSEVKGVNELEEGDVPAEFVCEGKRIPLDLRTTIDYITGKLKSEVNPFRAGGLTEEEIKRLQKSVDKIRVKKTFPFVPVVLLTALGIFLMCGGLWHTSLPLFCSLR